MDYYLAGLPLSPIFDAYLYSDTEASTTLLGGSVLVSHAPNAEIAELARGLTAPNLPGFVTFNPLTPLPALNAGSFYWLFLTPNNPQTSVVWDNYALEVDGTLLTPEPATFGLITSALLSIPALRRKRASKA